MRAEVQSEAAQAKDSNFRKPREYHSDAPWETDFASGSVRASAFDPVDS